MILTYKANNHQRKQNPYEQNNAMFLLGYSIN